MINQQIANMFREIANFLEMDAIAFKPAAYRRAAWGVESSDSDVRDIYEKGGVPALEELPGVGKDLALKIEEFIKTGKMGALEELRAKTPVDVTNFTRIEGVGPKTVKKLYEGLKIKTLEELEDAARNGKIRELAGFDEKKEENILRGIEFLKKEKGRILVSHAYELGELLKKQLLAQKKVKKVEVVGSLRRMKETIGDVDILAVSSDAQKTADAFATLPEVEEVYGKGTLKVNVRLKNGVDADLRIVAKEEFGAALQYFTGSKEHNIKLRIIATKKGLKLNEYGLFKGAKRIAGKDEKEIYEKLGMAYIEPELREDAGEIEAALKGKLPKLIGYNAIKGDLQVQTNWSDGEHSIAVMAQAAFAAGLSYIGITDHTGSLKVANGLDAKRLEKQFKEIDDLNKNAKGKFRILKSAEIDILESGALDISDELLARLDYALITVHTHFRMSEGKMTERIVKALKNPLADIMGHPTGRLVLKRQPYEVDMKEIIGAAKEWGVALEVNAFPERLDLKDVYIREAVGAGVKLVISSDAHNKNHFPVLRFGIGQARRGWAQAADVINTLPLEKFLKQLRRRKKSQ